MSFCPNCETEVRPGDETCRRCGAPLRTTAGGTMIESTPQAYDPHASGYRGLSDIYDDQRRGGSGYGDPSADDPVEDYEEPAAYAEFELEPDERRERWNRDVVPEERPPVTSPARPSRPQERSRSERRAGDEGTASYRPMSRPPMARICLLDDDATPDSSKATMGEFFRIRGNRFVIGRAEGDALVPHDLGVSGKHCEFVRTVADKTFVWKLVDLESRNGTFVAVREVGLKGKRELILGSRRYRFMPAIHPALRATAEAPTESQQTIVAKAPRREDMENAVPRLVDISEGENGPSYKLVGNRIVIGSDMNDCQVVIKGDPMLSPTHAEIEFDGSSAKIRDLGSYNGVWARIEGEQTLYPNQTVRILVGEQRILFQIC